MGTDFVYYSLSASCPADPSGQSIHPLSKLRGILVQRVKEIKIYYVLLSGFLSPYADIGLTPY
jgi:hypothetical protein